MNYDEVRATLTDCFKSEFAVTYPTTPIHYENVRFVRPDGAAWGDFSIQFGKSKASAIGGLRYRTVGVVNIQLFVPEDTGTKLLNEMSSKAFSIFKDRSWSLPDGKLWTYGCENRTRPINNGFAGRSVQFAFFMDTAS